MNRDELLRALASLIALEQPVVAREAAAVLPPWIDVSISFARRTAYNSSRRPSIDCAGLALLELVGDAAKTP